MFLLRMQGEDAKVKIAFIGKARAGKTTAAGIAMQRGFIRKSLAAPLKEALIAGLNELRLPCRSEHFTSDKTPESRKFMQACGHYVRSLDPMAFINYLLKGCEKGRDIVVDDCRFINEMQRFKEEGFKLVRIVRPNERTGDNDLSETESDRIADEVKGYYTIWNDSTLAKFQGKVKSLISRFKANEKKGKP